MAGPVKWQSWWELARTDMSDCSSKKQKDNGGFQSLNSEHIVQKGWRVFTRRKVLNNTLIFKCIDYLIWDTSYQVILVVWAHIRMDIWVRLVPKLWKSCNQKKKMTNFPAKQRFNFIIYIQKKEMDSFWMAWSLKEGILS